jgi:hypothetical protein
MSTACGAEAAARSEPTTRFESNLVSGYLLLMRQGRIEILEVLDAQGWDLLRRRVELAQLSLPRDRFPHSVASAHEVADVWLSDPDQWWPDTVDLIVYGLEKMLERSRYQSQAGVDRPDTAGDDLQEH